MLKKTNHMAPSRRGFLRVICASFIAIPVMPLIARAQKAAQSVAAIAKSAGLSGSKSIVVMDALTGEVLDSYKGSKSLPPASVTKIATAVYALSVLGADTRLKTRLITTGPIENGVLKGDLILAGSGDPRLDSDALGSLVEQLKARGLKTVRGKFYVYAGSLRYQRQIDPDQLEHVGYNPAIGGINLNFNRVYFKGSVYETYARFVIAAARQARDEGCGASMTR